MIDDSTSSAMGFDEQLLGLSKIETIDYRWLLRRGDRCSPGELLRKEELEKKHQAALSAQSVDMAASELAARKKMADKLDRSEVESSFFRIPANFS